MKAIKQPSLFFYLILFFFLLIHKTYGQQQSIDSLQYYYELTMNPKTSNDLLKAFTYYDDFKKKSLKKGDFILAIYALRTVAIIQYKRGALNDSENSVVEALEILDSYKAHDSVKIEPKLGLYNHLGKIYRELENYEDALKYYKKAENIGDNLKNLMTIKNNIGIVYLKQKKYVEAINYFNIALENSIEINNKKEMARIRSNLGFAQSKLNIEQGLVNLELALELRKKLKLNDGIITSYIHLGEYYADRGAKSEAEKYAKKALNISNITNNITHRYAALDLLTDLNEDSYVHEYKRINDSIIKANKLNKNKNSSVRYRLNKQIEANNKIEIDKRNNKIIFIFISVLLILSTIYSYFILKSKHKKKTLQAVYKTESHISKKVHDEVANDVFQVMNTLQNNANVNEKIIDDLDAIYIKTRNISKEHSVLDYEGNFKETLNDLLLSYNSDAVRVIIKDIDKVNWDAISKLKKETIYKVLQELMVNMKKHSQAEFVALTFKNINKKIAITYSDDGVGTSLKKNTGLQNMENRIQSINGTINFESGINKGFKSKITV